MGCAPVGTCILPGCFRSPPAAPCPRHGGRRVACCATKHKPMMVSGNAKGDTYRLYITRSGRSPPPSTQPPRAAIARTPKTLKMIAWLAPVVLLRLRHAAAAANHANPQLTPTTAASCPTATSRRGSTVAVVRDADTLGHNQVLVATRDAVVITAPAVTPTSNGPVSYTHLTLPTKA